MEQPKILFESIILTKQKFTGNHKILLAFDKVNF